MSGLKRDQKNRYQSPRHSVRQNIYWKAQRGRKHQETEQKDDNPGTEAAGYAAEVSGRTVSEHISRQIQKKRIKKEYARRKRQGQFQTVSEKIGAVLKTTFLYGKGFAVKNAHCMSYLIVSAVVLFGVIGLCSSCAAMFQGSTGAVLGTSYTAEDADIIGVNEDYNVLEEGLREEISHMEQTHPGYDEYTYELQEISHDPYELTAYLTVRFEDYERSEVQAELLQLFSRQYTLTLEEKSEIRTRDEVRTGYRTVIDPNTGLETMEEYQYVEEVAYEHRILCVKLLNKSLKAAILDRGLSFDQMERYGILMDTKGNRAYLFGGDIYANAGEVLEYDIPGEALTDCEFAALIREAERHLGKSYVWGGSTPQTGFDCSGFVCWVFNQMGKNVGRTTANGLLGKCDIIRPSEAKPGDLIFFQGTYHVSGASHVGIYVGNNMMIHCGNPISYASISSAYWQEHFLCFGRL